MIKFRLAIADWLYWLADLIDIPPDFTGFRKHVRDLILDKQRINVDGEYKRHMVYAELIKRFPDMRKRDIALAIEEVLQEVL